MSTGTCPLPGEPCGRVLANARGIVEHSLAVLLADGSVPREQLLGSSKSFRGRSKFCCHESVDEGVRAGAASPTRVRREGVSGPVRALQGFGAAVTADASW